MRNHYEVPVISSAGAASFTINSTANVASHSFKVKYGERFSLIIDTESSGVVDLDIYIYQSNVLPAAEGTIDSNWVIPENISKLSDITATGRIITAYSPVVYDYALVYVDGQGSNDASTAVTIVAQMIEVIS